jgi:DNA polymerase III delta prime subunit
MEILSNLDKNNLHHAYLIEGTQEEVVPEILKFVEGMGIKTSNNPDFYHLSFDSFKIDDARKLKSIEYEKSFLNDKKIFIISANVFLLEAQNTLLKIFEEPIENTHFFIVVPDTNTLLRTLVSRFYLIKTKTGLEKDLTEAEKFIKMPIKSRIDYIKEILIEAEEKDQEEDTPVVLESTRSKALKLLNALEVVLHQKFLKDSPQFNFFSHLFKVREFLSQPGSSVKSLMESVALILPNF